jgi:prepilin-type N-terminal cleavage/methylation domain-containing protein
MRIHNTRSGGFTLVEIMIVVAIIGLLATVAVPNFVKARTTAQKNACINNLQKLEGAVQTWAMETRQGPDSPVAFTDISPYLKNAVVCPSGGRNFGDSYNLGTVNDRPSCKKEPTNHALPEETLN